MDKKVFEVKEANKIILVKIIVDQQVLWYLSAYAPKCGCGNAVKYPVNDLLSDMTALIPASEFLISYGDWSGHVGNTGSTYKEINKGCEYDI